MEKMKLVGEEFFLNSLAKDISIVLINELNLRLTNKILQLEDIIHLYSKSDKHTKPLQQEFEKEKLSNRIETLESENKELLKKYREMNEMKFLQKDNNQESSELLLLLKFYQNELDKEKKLSQQQATIILERENNNKIFGEQFRMQV